MRAIHTFKLKTTALIATIFFAYLIHSFSTFSFILPKTSGKQTFSDVFRLNQMGTFGKNELKNWTLIFFFFNYYLSLHCVKSVRIRIYSGPYFPALWLSTEGCCVSLRIQSKCGNIRTRVTPTTDTFYAVSCILILFASSPIQVQSN